MLNQWFPAACAKRRLAPPGLRQGCRRAAHPRLENLEHRLAMSSCSTGGVVDLNLIVLNPDGRETTVSPYQRHAEAIESPHPDPILRAPGQHLVRPDPDGLGTKHAVTHDKSQ
jgi:hypothetical protein